MAPTWEPDDQEMNGMRHAFIRLTYLRRLDPTGVLFCESESRAET